MRLFVLFLIVILCWVFSSVWQFMAVTHLQAVIFCFVSSLLWGYFLFIFAYFYLLLGESSALCDSLTCDVWLSPICKLLESVFIVLVISSVWQLGLNRPSCHPFASFWSWRFIYLLFYSFALGHQLCVAAGPELMSFVVMLLVWLLPICKLLEFRVSDFLLWLGQ